MVIEVKGKFLDVTKSRIGVKDYYERFELSTIVGETWMIGSSEWFGKIANDEISLERKGPDFNNYIWNIIPDNYSEDIKKIIFEAIEEKIASL